MSSGTNHVSLLVHEAPEVVADQIRNINRYLPDATTLIHVSATSRMTTGTLEETIRVAGGAQFILNPVRTSTSWGNVIAGHIANLRLMLHQPGEDGTVMLLSSNDMLVRPESSACHTRRYATRRVTPQSSWRWAQKVSRDPILTEILGSPEAPVIQSQVEGTVYERTQIERMWPQVERYEALTRDAPAEYPAEEVLLPTLSWNSSAPPMAPPAIFSEMTWMESRVARVSRWTRGGLSAEGYSELAARIAGRMWKTRTISMRDVESIRQLELPSKTSGWIADGPHRVEVARAGALIGVKRVPREINAPLRRAIRALPNAW